MKLHLLNTFDIFWNYSSTRHGYHSLAKIKLYFWKGINSPKPHATYIFEIAQSTVITAVISLKKSREKVQIDRKANE